ARLGREARRAGHLRPEPRWCGGNRTEPEPGWRRQEPELRPGRWQYAQPADRLNPRRDRPGARYCARNDRALHPRWCRLHGSRLGTGGGSRRCGASAVSASAAADGNPPNAGGVSPNAGGVSPNAGGVSPNAGGAPPIEVRGLVKRYGELTAVAGVDLTVNTGDVYGYLGPNGAGKTTSLRMMPGLIRPTEGSVRLFGRDPMEGVRALDGVAGFVEAPTFYPYLNARRNLELLAAFDGHGAPERIDQ